MLSRIALVLLSAAALGGAETPRSADALLDKAKAEAAPNHRAIWVMFHASW
jgi:hypothetical protein